MPKRNEKKTATKPLLDLMDQSILKNAKKTPGANIAKITGPLRSPDWSDPSLRYRLRTLVRDGFLKLEKTRTGQVLVFPLEQ